MTYENHLRCNISVNDNESSYKVASFAQDYDIYNAGLISFIKENVTSSTTPDNGYLDVTSNVVYANIDSDTTTIMELNTVYHMYVLMNDVKVLAKLNGNISPQQAPVISDLTIERIETNGYAHVTGNVTNTVGFGYYVILTRTQIETQANLENHMSIRSLTRYTNTSFDITFSEPYERDQFPFLQYTEPYYAYVYAKNIHEQVSVTSITLLADTLKTKHIGMGLSNLHCDNMGDLSNTDARIELDIRFDASHASLEYYALAFSNTGTGFAGYANRDIYTDYTITGNTENTNVSFVISRDYTGNVFSIDTDVRVAVLLVDKETRQFSGEANVIDMNISEPNISGFGIVPIYQGYMLE
jgi:hypothetical protein